MEEGAVTQHLMQERTFDAHSARKAVVFRPPLAYGGGIPIR